MTPSAPKILVFDSGLGGLTVFVEVAKLRPHARLFYCADDAGFPYGPLPEDALAARMTSVMETLVAEVAPDLVVIACNTASTLALPHLRARWPHIPFVGTVPAIKPAAERSRSRLISVLATPGTVARDYTRGLIASFADHCEVTLVGSTRLAPIAEDFMRGAPVSEAEIAREIAPCFVTKGEARTDAVTLACTHYPLLVDFFRRLAPWPVDWIDPAPAIARQADRLLAGRFGPDRPEAPAAARRALFTSGAPPEPTLRAALARFGLGDRF